MQVPLLQAIETLARAHEKVFLANVGPIALGAAEQSGRGKSNKPFAYNNGNRRVHCIGKGCNHCGLLRNERPA